MNKKVDDYLEHFGILGMKWGVRRKSKDRIAKARAKTQEETTDRSEDYKKSRMLKRKKLSEMSNQEIETLTRRMQLETNYARLTAPTKSKGRTLVDNALKTVGKKVASEFNKQFIEPRIEQTMTKLLERLANRRRRPA